MLFVCKNFSPSFYYALAKRTRSRGCGGVYKHTDSCVKIFQKFLCCWKIQCLPNYLQQTKAKENEQDCWHILWFLVLWTKRNVCFHSFKVQLSIEHWVGFHNQLHFESIYIEPRITHSAFMAWSTSQFAGTIYIMETKTVRRLRRCH